VTYAIILLYNPFYSIYFLLRERYIERGTEREGHRERVEFLPYIFLKKEEEKERGRERRRRRRRRV